MAGEYQNKNVDFLKGLLGLARNNFASASERVKKISQIPSFLAEAPAEASPNFTSPNASTFYQPDKNIQRGASGGWEEDIDNQPAREPTEEEKKQINAEAGVDVFAPAVEPPKNDSMLMGTDKTSDGRDVPFGIDKTTLEPEAKWSKIGRLLSNIGAAGKIAVGDYKGAKELSDFADSRKLENMQKNRDFLERQKTFYQQKYQDAMLKAAQDKATAMNNYRMESLKNKEIPKGKDLGFYVDLARKQHYNAGDSEDVSTEDLLAEGMAMYEASKKYNETSNSSPPETKVINGVTYKKVDGGWSKM